MRVDLLPTIPGRALPQAPRAWQAGQVLLARVEGREGELTLLRIGGALYRAEGAPPLPAGQELALEVAEPGPPPVLRLLRGADDGVLTAALARAALPRQLPLAEALGRLLRLLSGERLAPPAREAAAALRAHLAAPRDPEGLRRAVLAAGPFLEARLARAAAEGRPPPQDDLKAALLRLAAHLPEGGAAEALEGALARIETAQLGALPRAGEPVVLAVELPLPQGEGLAPLTLRFEREARPGMAAGEGWSVTVGIELPELGPVWARIRLRGDDAAVTLWAEREATRRRLADTEALLRAQLEAAGLAAGGIHVRAEPAPPLPQARPPGPVVDEEA
ncbi:flagellar hook-length control protein FliK [Inmirania thermothiophila]|uniref:Flagellar hook-length control protein FliK n=1 Tax=Inmirania thermothiophila TaxID=1750597 RepID=A0A3N1Y8J7_9GAMM|nr:flagellar hook-length control protein FliK [Inmirania thermothiophila]ROR35139.1 flagellar hook-length control protein FliK [Inmirania thermothiophila]